MGKPVGRIIPMYKPGGKVCFFNPDDLDPEMIKLAKELIVDIRKGEQPEFDRIIKVKNKVYLTRIGAYVSVFTLFWTLAFIAVITSWNFINSIRIIYGIL